MTDNRKVGSPKDNPGRMEPRSVAVQKDKPRINDERKVRPHTSGDPAMGIRPSGGAQKPSGEFSDKLAGEYIQARDVPMQTMTEAELAEWNPFASFFKSRQESTIPGISVGYQITKDGIDLYLLQDSKPIAHKRVDSHEGVSTKMKQLKHEYEYLKQQRLALSINPDRIGRQAAWEFAKEQGVKPQKVGALNRDIPVHYQGGMGAQQQQGPQAAAAQPGPTASPRPGAGPMRRPQSAAPNVGWGHRGEPMGNLRKEWDRRSSGPKPDFNVDSGGTARPGAPAAGAPGGPATNGASFMVGPEQVQMMYKNAPEYFPAHSLDKLSPYQLSQVWNAFVSNKPTKGMMNNYHRFHAGRSAMAAESVQEGYPDTNFEREQPAHTARIGDLGWKGKGKQPGVPSANKGFMQALDLHIEKVTEMADSDIDDMIARTMNRLGLEEAMHGGPEADTVTLPAYWASALVNGDFSGLDEDETHQCQMMMHKLAQDGWQVVGTSEEEPHFTWNYQVHNPHSQYKGGDVMDYIVHRARGPAMPPHQEMPQQYESYTGSVSWGPQGAAPIAETKIPRARARWV